MAYSAIIFRFLEKIKIRLTASIPIVTGRTVDSLETRADEYGGQLLAAPHIGAVEYGRSPRRTNKDMGFWKELQLWLAAKGMDSTMKNAKRLAWSINTFGTEQWQSGSGSGALTDIINDGMFDELVNDIGDKELINISSEVLNVFDKMK
jgi:hypothetical protein